MADPGPTIAVVAARGPSAQALEAGKEYYWCACGRSKSQPFCDGSHATTSITPKPFKATATETKYLCQCKRTKNPPFCDGSHAALPDTDELVYSGEAGASGTGAGTGDVGDDSGGGGLDKPTDAEDGKA